MADDSHRQTIARWRLGPLNVDVSVDDAETPAIPLTEWPASAPAVRSDFAVRCTHGHLPRDVGRLGVRCDAFDVNKTRFSREGAFVADVDFAHRSGSYRGDIASDAAIESFLRVLTSSLLSRAGGALLHAASIAVADGAYVFCGVSGAGKSTLVARVPDGSFLADDQTIVAWDAVGFRVWGSPFAGALGRRAPPTSHPLRALVLLSPERPAATRIVRRHDLAAAAGELVRHVCSFEESVAEAVRALDFVRRIIDAVPIYSLARHLDDDVIAIVAGLSGEAA